MRRKADVLANYDVLGHTLSVLVVMTGIFTLISTCVPFMGW